MEKMSIAEKKTLNDLQAKWKRVQRAEAEFLKEADSRKDELLVRWGAADNSSSSKQGLFAEKEEADLFSSFEALQKDH